MSTQRNQNILASIGLAMGALFGVTGSAVTVEHIQVTAYALSSVGLVFGCVLLAMKYFRAQQDYIAAGFLILAIAEAVMHGGTAAGQVGGQPSFGAGMSLYLPALLFISLPKGMPLIPRITGIAACIPFGIAAAKIFHGQEVLSTSALPGAGYGLLVLTIIGWIWTLLREKE